MKKIIILICSAIILFACGNDDNVSSSSKTQLEGTWESILYEEDGNQFTRIEFNGAVYYINRVQLEDDGAELVLNVEIGDVEIEDNGTVTLSRQDLYKIDGSGVLDMNRSYGTGRPDVLDYSITNDTLQLNDYRFFRIENELIK